MDLIKKFLREKLKDDITSSLNNKTHKHIYAVIKFL